ncbi:MAG: hypothetical protein HOP33_08895 [Verrucomicrobia bacterium]|nr:hypothetical protein [Verrucomicrobiota bacterium]
MPIRLNLLAEAQAAEELRRRDPVKRAIWIAAMLVALMLIWSSSLYFKFMVNNSELSKVQLEINTLTNSYKEVTDNLKKSADINQKLQALQTLSTNRFLSGTMLNALQKNTLDDVQLTHLGLRQEYLFVEETKATTNASRVIPGKPATSTERISLEFDATDSSTNPGDLVATYKDLLLASSYFKEGFGKPVDINLKSLSSPTLSPDTGKSCVLFKLECRFPEKMR